MIWKTDSYNCFCTQKKYVNFAECTYSALCSPTVAPPCWGEDGSVQSPLVHERWRALLRAGSPRSCSGRWVRPLGQQQHPLDGRRRPLPYHFGPQRGVAHLAGPDADQKQYCWEDWQGHFSVTGRSRVWVVELWEQLWLGSRDSSSNRRTVGCFQPADNRGW